MRLRITLAVVLLTFVPLAARDTVPRRLTVDDQFALKTVADPRISPDGAWVAYTVETADLAKDTTDTDLFMAPIGGGTAIRLTAGERADSAPRFSPDGRWIAFLGAKDDDTQVWLINRSGGDATPLTSYEASVSDLVWSPDSTRLAIVVADADPDADPEADPDASARDKDADDKKTGKPVVVTRLQFKRDGDGYLDDRRDHVHVFDIKTRTSRQLTSGPFDDGEPAWSPDGRTIAFSSNRFLPDADAGQNRDIFVVPAAGGIPRALVKTAREESEPVFSPDGTSLVYVSGGDPRDMWYGASHVAVVPVAGGTPRPLTADLDRNVLSPRFSKDGRHVYFLLEDGGTQPLLRVPADGGVPERLVQGDLELTAFDLGPAGEIVVLESSMTHPPEISRVTTVPATPAADLSRVTTVNDTFLASITLGKVERFTATGADGTRVDGFVTFPPGYASGTKLPAILRIHGGPASQYAASFDFELQILAAQGYAVITSNPRGSTGYGTAFSRAIWADWGNKDTDDVLAAVDHVVKLGIADPERLGVGGWSYGGILTNYVVTKTTRFKAATSGAGAANILAGYGTDHYQYEYEVELGLPWKARDTYLRLSSSFFDVEKITTPTMYLGGQLDMNVPLLNNEQLYQAVRRVNKVPTALVIYPDQWHGILTPSHRKDLHTRYIAWYDRFLKPGGAARAGETPEATSLLGTPLYRVVIAPAARKTADDNLESARAAFIKTPDDSDAIIWLGRRQAAAGHVADAIETYTRGIAKFPADPRFYRHRGHRYVTIRQFDKAIGDLTKATQLIVGKPDAPEPSTADPAVMSSETLHYAIWYHLGLAHYLKGDFAKAHDVFRRCLAGAAGNGDQTAGASDWLYMTLRRLGRAADAAKILESISPALAVKSDQSYFVRLQMYQGVYEPEDLLRAGGDPVTAATYGYAVGNWYLYNGREAEAKAVFERVVAGPNWMAFGYIASEAELARMK